MFLKQTIKMNAKNSTDFKVKKIIQQSLNMFTKFFKLRASYSITYK